MRIYVRKIMKHDVTHEVSVTTEIVKNFFDDQSSFEVIANSSQNKGIVTINNATDPRFGGDFKKILKFEGDVSIDDIVLIYKKSLEYYLEILKPTNPNYITFFHLFEEKNRHIVLEVDDINNDQNEGQIVDYSNEELVKLLKKYYDDYGYIGVHLFGIEYAKKLKKINKASLIIEAGIKESMKNELQKGIRLSNYVKKLKEPLKSDEILNDDEELENLKTLINDENRIEGGFNKIYYGVPGSGKSFKVSETFNKSEYNIKRTTFHPEYSNSDFLGQIIPKLNDGKVSYEFHPGPFTEILLSSLINKKEKFCLIIEEINRGNSSAIFGDVFQLLDRNAKGKSKYSIYNNMIIDYFQENGIEVDNISIPSNLWIIGTMNTSDQNVFTLDTAFKRRWKMEYIPNKFSDNEYSKSLEKTIIPFLGNRNITWGTFVNKVNRQIIKNSSKISGEDKQLGMYFLTIEELKNEKEFAEKILSYLWEDIAKLNPEEWFGNVESYDELLKRYSDSNLRVFDELFDDELKILAGYETKIVSEENIDGISESDRVQE